MNIPNQDIKNIQLRNQWNEALDATQKILNILTPVKQAASYNDAGIIDRYFTHVRIAKQYALQQAVDFLSFGPNAYQDPIEYMQHLHCVLGELKSRPGVTDGIFSHRTKKAIESCIRLACKSIEIISQMSEVPSQLALNIKSSTS